MRTGLQEPHRTTSLSPVKAVSTVFDGEERDAGLPLVALMDELSMRLRLILSSRRWLIGNAVVTTFNTMLRRPRRPLATQRMEKICTDYDTWKYAVFADASPKKLSANQMRRLDQWIRESDDAFQCLVQSRRWKTGSFFVEFARSVLLRSRKPVMIAQLEALFEHYRQNSRKEAAKQKPVTRLSLADVYYHLGFAHENSRRWAPAAHAYETALNLSPRPGRYYRLGRVRERQRQWEAAANAYREAVRRNPARPHSFFRLGYVCAKDGLWDEAAYAFESATALDATRSEWFYHLGQAREKTLSEVPQYLHHGGLQLRQQGDWAGAARAYMAAIAVDKLQPLYHFQLGHVRSKMRDFGGAASAFQEAVRLAPEKPQWLYRLARAHEQALEYEAALTAYQRLLAINPDHASAQSRAYTIHVKLAQWREASKAALVLREPALTRASESTHGRARPPDPAVVQRLRTLLERAESRATRAEAEALLLGCKGAAHLLPLDWWFALHWRFMKIGWFSLAYTTKDIAASLIAARSGDLKTIGLTKYLETAKALVQLGSKDAAIEHLQLTLESVENKEARIATQKLIADIEAHYGDFEGLEEIMPMHDGVNLREAEAAFHTLVSNKTTAIVGPTDNGLQNGEEIDSYDVVVRTNFLPVALTAERAAATGTRTDISYFNGVASKMLTCEIHQAVERRSLKLVVLRPFNYSIDRQLIVKPGDLRYNPAESNALLRARSFGVQRVLHDVLKYRPSRVKLFNIDFFVSSENYKKGCKARELLADVDPFFLGFGHDYRGDFVFTKNLWNRSLISGDGVVEKLIQLSADTYLATLDQKHNHTSDVILHEETMS